MTHVRFLAVILTALAFAPSADHLLELNNKIGLRETDYFVVQGIYRGWDLLGFLWAAAVIANGTLAYLLRDQRSSFLLAIAASMLIFAAVGVFFAFTYPTNVATQNWTVPPRHESELRMIWEYSHAANAFILFGALCCTTLAVVMARK